MSYKFRPGVFNTLMTLVLMTLCIKLGLWQQHKAELKQALQAQLDMRLKQAPVALPQKMTDPEAWRFRRVRFAGSYDATYQILQDNQVENTVAGYHVLTPLRIEGSAEYLLVNRGWVAGAADRRLPVIDTPLGVQDIVGDIWLPPNKFFTLQTLPQSDGKWQPVWENLDMLRYVKSVPFAVQPFVVRLEPQSAAGGFVRNWPRPAENIGMHKGYAYQWFSFALTLLLIFIVVNLKKVEY